MKNVKMTFCLIIAVLFIASNQGFGVIEFKDGGTYNINYTINDNVWVNWQTPDAQTTVNLLNGGELLGTHVLDAFNNSEVTMSGGQAGSLYARGSSQVTMSGGKLTNHLMCNDSSLVKMLDGQVGYLMSYNNSRVTMSGGIVTYHLLASDSGRLTMSGGTITQDLRVGVNAILTIDGSNFSIDGSPFSFGEITSKLGGSFENESFRRLTGTLANGDIINNQFRIGDNAKIVLVPEPTTLVLFGLGGLLLKRRNK